MNIVRSLVVAASVVVGSTVAASGIASASTTVEFQLNPAPYGNPNGSVDLAPIRCAAVVGEQPGTVRITGGDEDGWGCLISSQVYWLNLSTGASGTATTGPGLDGFPPEATLVTGAGQVAVTILSSNAVVTPGAAAIAVP